MYLDLQISHHFPLERDPDVMYDGRYIDSYLSSSAWFVPTGDYYISGVFLIDGAPVRRRVSLMKRSTMSLFSTTYSDESTGEYEFTGLPYDQYMVVFDDSNMEYNACVFDWVTPER